MNLHDIHRVFQNLGWWLQFDVKRWFIRKFWAPKTIVVNGVKWGPLYIYILYIYIYPV